VTETASQHLPGDSTLPVAGSPRPPGRLLFFWDYDTQWGGDRSRAPGGRKSWGALEFPNTDQLLELHAAADVAACFAVVGRAAQPGARPYHDPTQIRRIRDAGHEVASHGLEHEWLPALDQNGLRRSLAESKDALEQCLGERISSFVPPYNQPFDHWRRLSISLSERRQASGVRTDLPALCRALREAGYDFCRVAYRPAAQRLAEAFLGRRRDRPVEPEAIEGLCCVRLNTPGGFAEDSVRVVERAASRGGVAVVYGHPHSLHSGNSQDLAHLRPFLDRVRALRDQKSLEILQPRDLLSAP
jgi:peptidoglycan/xylan/chitin deacetylase (PgdA/CDA1 family)